jgi:hypothetical protein
MESEHPRPGYRVHEVAGRHMLRLEHLDIVVSALRDFLGRRMASPL